MIRPVEIKIKDRKPVAGCETCLTGWKQLASLYQMYYDQPADPGAIGLFEAEQEIYLAHRQTHDIPLQGDWQ